MASGDNTEGQLGLGHTVSQQSFQVLDVPERITHLEAGSHPGALSQSGSLYLWGKTSLGQFLAPHRISHSAQFSDIAVGNFFGVAIDQVGHAYSWGLTTGAVTEEGEELMRVENLKKKVYSISAGGSHVAALGDLKKKGEKKLDRSKTKGQDSRRESRP